MNSLTDLSAGVAAMLKNRGETISVAESSTGGLISAALLATPGASGFFEGGGVVYSLESRRQLLGVTDSQVADLSPLSEEYIAICAVAIRQKLGTTWSIAEIGASGPAGTRYGHPPGICALAIDGPLQVTRLVETGSNDREANMWAFAKAALGLLGDAMQKLVTSDLG
ncbi:MAG TPA: damage-inducible protein [Gammaproteobacteria bacterium]|nr:damage-inducible protein [Gammaproteobacteria bacterium]